MSAPNLRRGAGREIARDVYICSRIKICLRSRLRLQTLAGTHAFFLDSARLAEHAAKEKAGADVLEARFVFV